MPRRACLPKVTLGRTAASANHPRKSGVEATGLQEWLQDASGEAIRPEGGATTGRGRHIQDAYLLTFP